MHVGQANRLKLQKNKLQNFLPIKSQVNVFESGFHMMVGIEICHLLTVS